MKCNNQQQKVFQSGSRWRSFSTGRVVLSVAELEMFTFRPGPSLTRGEKVWTGQDCLIEFVQAVSWDGNVNELWLLQQCYNHLLRYLDGYHLQVVSFPFFFFFFYFVGVLWEFLCSEVGCIYVYWITQFLLAFVIHHFPKKYWHWPIN
jgi:hypothetical protein